MSEPKIVTTRRFAEDAAAFIVTHGQRAIASRGVFRLGLAGGNTPRVVHQALVARGTDLDWDRVQITFGDERCVPPDHPESNYRMARESLFDHLPLRAESIVRMRGEMVPEEAAAEYDVRLSALAQAAGEARYIHDLLLLGLGPDGHTASLFPGSPALQETLRNAVAVIGPKPPPQRITLTFPVINAAQHVCFLVNDRAKRPVIEEITEGRSTLPAASVRPTRGALTWLLSE